MSKLKALIIALIGIVVVVLGILFTVHNSEQIHVDFIVFTSPMASVALWLTLAFFVGGVVGILLSSVRIATLKGRLHRVQKKLNAAQAEKHTAVSQSRSVTTTH